ncbi:MAG: tRNA uridine-5-carboxymethylaminomethyl(34) synthesis enzyme MnmG [Alphaproteobacteria bacterium]|nr:tRNA uridine-5-carboxymethylaminomethyl(34) synthesis enzyme MnmG [Alphaproteobacteria bacterium]
MKKYDVLVVGGGHAGVEASCASARLGCQTLLVTFSQDNLGKLSCNPSIGGLGKGHIVREIDALDGVMARAVDEAGIHFRVLNRSKGYAVQGPRAQLDRNLYQKAIQKHVAQQKNLTVLEDEVIDILLEDKKVVGIQTKKQGTILAKSVVLTTGTFLRGLMHVGEEKTVGGRIGEKEAVKLSEGLENLGIQLVRLKTGTPARLRKSSLNFDVCEIQPSDENPEPFSYLTKEITNPQVDCYLTETHEAIHEMIRNNSERAPLYNGQIASTGPRYCPSIEDKVMRFKHHQKHTVFLEPEGLNSDLVYPNGISTSLPKDIQEKMIHSIKGCENAEIVQYGYAIEYDAIDPRMLKPTLEAKDFEGLFFAGQINGTSGYEEAGGQGLIAGLNAGLKAQGKESFILSRTQGYIGVLIDDITTLGVDEPYRMFTSRAEYRLYLRADNADQRLTPFGIRLKCVSQERKEAFLEKQDALVHAKEMLQSKRHNGKSFWEHLKNPQMDSTDLGVQIDESIRKQIVIEAKYEGYIHREQADIAKYEKDLAKKIPLDFDYKKISGLTNEVQQKLEKTRPSTLAQAKRIQGMTPVAIITLMKKI